MYMISIHNTSSVLFDLLLRTLAGGGRPVCLMGIVGFACFFFNDWNDCHKGKKGLRWLFPAGAVLLGVAVAGLCIGRAAPLSGVPQKIAGIFALVFAVTEIYTLFFALPAGPSYTEPGAKRQAVVHGVYALCRHPGVLWMIGLLLCLWLCCGFPLWAAAIYSLLDIFLVVYEDRCVFPVLLDGYGAYQKETPFLIPSFGSIRAAVTSFRMKNKEKERVQ